MAIIERRLLGAIVDYNPMEGRGIISDVESSKEIPFFCQHIRSDALRSKFAVANRFKDPIFIQPNIYVTYAVCSSINGDIAGRIEPYEDILANLDVGAPVTGYIQYFGVSHTGTGGLSGWINPHSNGDEQGSSWFDLSKVIDPALRAHLLNNANIKKYEWKEQGIRVRYWKMNERRSYPSCAFVALTDDALRDRWLKKYSVKESDVRKWEKVRDKYLSAPDNIAIPAYVELPIQRAPLTMRENRIQFEFHQEAYDVTASNPAQRGQLDYLWEMVKQSRDKDLEDALSRLPNIKGTKLAIICQAACHYLNHDYADSLEMCYNAQRYDYSAKLAMEMEKHEIAQRLAELALEEEPTEKRIQTLWNTAIHTGNALVFCDHYQEMIDAYKNGEDVENELDLYTEASIGLLDAVGVPSDTMEAAEICQAVRERYNRVIPPLHALLAELRESEKDRGKEQSFIIPKNRLTAPTYYHKEKSVLTGTAFQKAVPPRQQTNAAALMDDFKNRFMVDRRYRLPDQSTDSDAIPMIDTLLGEELPSVNDYRMPLLVRVFLAPDSSEQAIQHYIERLQAFLDNKRKRYNTDRRWRLVMALLEYVKATDGKSRSVAWENAWNEKQGEDESLLLEALLH